MPTCPAIRSPDACPAIKTPCPARAPKPSSSATAGRVAVLHALLSVRHGPRHGATVEDVDGNVFLDCAAGIAVNSTGHSHPDVVAAIVDQAQKFLHMSGTDFYYEPQVRLGEEMNAIAPWQGAEAIVLLQLRHRGDRGGDQAGALSHQALRHHRVSRQLSRPHARVAVGDVEQGDSAPGLRPAARRRLSRAVPESAIAARPGESPRRAPPRASTSSRTRSSCISSRRTKSRRCSSSRSRAKAATSCRRRVSPAPARADAASTACC